MDCVGLIFLQKISIKIVLSTVKSEYLETVGDMQIKSRTELTSSSNATDSTQITDADVSSSNGSNEDAEASLKNTIKICEFLLKGDRYTETLRLLTEAIQAHPSSSDLHNLIGQCYSGKGDSLKSIESFVRAEALDPRNFRALINLASAYHSKGELVLSLETVQKAYEINPDNDLTRRSLALVLNDYGNKIRSEGQMNESLRFFERAIEVHPNFAPALYNIGVHSSENGEKEKAEEYYRKAAEADATHSMTWANLGSLLSAKEELDEAIKCFRKAIETGPKLQPVYQGIATVLTKQGRKSRQFGNSQKAIVLFTEALSYDPTNVEALYNLGVEYSEAGEVHKAVFMYQTAIHYCPQLAEAHNNLGVLYKDLGNPERAFDCYKSALSCNPDFVLGLSNLGLLYAMQGEAEESMALLQKAISLNPTVEAYNNLGVIQKDAGLIHESLKSYQESLKISPDSRNPADNFLLGLNYIKCGSLSEVSDNHIRWGTALSNRTRHLPPVARSRDKNKILKVGYLSGDLCIHSVSYFVEAPLSAHRQSQVHHIIYNCSEKSDEKTELLKKGVKKSDGIWKEVKNLNEQELSELIRQDEVDILVELSGHTSHNRLGALAMKPAPIQVTWIGYPNTTGLAEVDYRLTDSTCDPEKTEQVFSEELVRLPGCFLCYTPIKNPPPVSPAPCLENGFVTFGSFNGLCKINEEVLRIWALILREIPKARLVLKNKTFACITTRDRYAEKFRSQGVDLWRLDLLPLSALTKDHLSLYSLMDISLDPWPYAGTTTTCESFLMGVPCITLAGQCHAQNVGMSLIRSVGLDESWIAHSAEEYILSAVRHAEDLQALASLRSSLRDKLLSSELCDKDGHVAKLEGTYRRMWHRWCDSDCEKIH